jgi:HPt (histidine-containing phosphotransfer) domain-containing protein
MSIREFDDEALEELRDDLGEAFDEFAAGFFANATAELQALQAGLAAGGLGEAAERAHKLKGTAGYLGAVGLSDCLAQLQRSAEAGDTERAGRLAAEAVDALARLRGHVAP